MTTLRQQFIVIAALLLLSPIVAHAQTLTAAWDPNPSADQVTSYTVCIGTTSLSCNFRQASVPANQSTYQFTPNAGVLYYVAVRAVSAAGAGPYSQEITVSSPSLSQPGNRTSTVNQAISPLSLSASDPDGDSLRFSHTGLPFGLTLNATTGVITGTPTNTGTFNVTVLVADDLVTTSQSFVWTVSGSSDTAQPSLTVTSHSSGQTVTSSSITLAGTASDSGAGNSGISSVTVNGAAATGGTAATSGTANWSRTVALSTGANTLTVVATDGAGNSRSTQITITRGSSDSTPPALAITSHTTGQTVTSSPITLRGTATDNGAGNSGITSVLVNGAAATGGTASGTATSNWSRSVALSAGANTLTVVARDGAGNQRTSSVSVTYTAPVSTMTGASLSQNQTSPQTLGDTITFTASGSGGVGPYQYQWYVQPSGGSQSMVRSWSTTTSYAWTPTQAGTYVISIWARSAGATANTAQATAQRTFVIDAPAGAGTGVVAGDSFTGSSGTTLTSRTPDVSPGGARWVHREGGAPRIQSGRAMEVASSVGFGLATLETGVSNGSVVVDIMSTGATPFNGVVFRALDTDRLLLLRYAGNSSVGLVGLFRRVNGVFELIDQATVAAIAPGSSHRLGVELSGSQVRATLDGDVVLTRTVADYQTATQHGLMWYSDDPSAQFDNFVVTSGAVAPPPPPPATNGPPVITGPANQTHATGTAVSVPIVASDPEGSALQYGASGLPAGVTVNTGTGMMSGTISANAGAYPVTTTASDGTTTATRTFTWTVTSTAPPPPPPPTSGVVARDAFTASSGTTLTSRTPDVSPGGARWVHREGGAPRIQSGRAMEVASSVGFGLATLETGVSNGSVVVDIMSTGATPFNGVVFRALDTDRLLLLRYAGNSSVGLVGLFRRVNGTFVLIDQVTVAAIAPGSRHQLGVELSGSQVRAMWDGDVVLTRTVTDYQTATQHGLMWHSDDPSAQFDNFVVTGNGGGATPPPPATNGPPVITGPANQTHATGTAVSVPIVASDPEGSALQYGASGLPSGVTVNTGSGLMSGTISANAGAYTVTTTASDGTTTATRTFTWTVTSTAPPTPPPPTSGVVVRDTFTGSSGMALTAHTPDVSPGTLWVQRQGAIANLVNGAVGEVSWSTGFGLATVESGAANASVSMDLRSNGPAPFAGLVFRAVDTDRLLLLRYAGNSMTGLIGLFRRVNGSFELLQQATVPAIAPGSNHRLSVNLAGSQVQVLFDGRPLFTRTVTDYQTATQHGLIWHSDDPYAYYDNFTVTAP